MGAVPGTLSRRRESQAPGPRFFNVRQGRWIVAGTMSNPARPGGGSKFCGSCSARVSRAMVEIFAEWASVRVAWRPGAPAFWSAAAGAAGGPASRHRRGRARVDWKVCDHADGAPAAFLVVWRGAPGR